MESPEKELTITHLFDADIDRVFGAWTDPEKLKHWYAPDGCTIEYRSIEVRPGGRFHYCITHPVHGKNWVIGTYIDILPLKKIAFTIRFSNEHGEEIDAIGNKNLAFWPSEIVVTVIFEPIGNQTKAVIHETVSEEKAKKTGAYRGWMEMFDKLNQQLINH